MKNKHDECIKLSNEQHLFEVWYARLYNILAIMHLISILLASSLTMRQNSDLIAVEILIGVLATVLNFFKLERRITLHNSSSHMYRTLANDVLLGSCEDREYYHRKRLIDMYVPTNTCCSNNKEETQSDNELVIR